MKPQRFATAINCMDGRAQLPAMDWLRLHCNVDYVDLITEPGAVKYLTQESSDEMFRIRKTAKLAFDVHASSVIAVVGHHDCLANPVSKEEQVKQIGEAVTVVGSWGLAERVVGLYVNEWRSVDLVSDTLANRSVGHRW
jgi:hypothetical protein